MNDNTTQLKDPSGLTKILRHLLDNELLLVRSTFIELFSIPISGQELVYKKDGYWYFKPLDIKLQKETLPPLDMTAKVSLPKGFTEIIKEDIDTTIGRFILNYLIIEYSLDNFTDYINEQFTYKTIEPKVVQSIVRTSIDPEVNGLTVDNLRRVALVVSFLRSMSQVLVVSATEDTMYPTKEFFNKRKEVRKEYEEKYGDKWFHNDILMVGYEEDMLKYAKEVIYKDDPSLNITLSRKALGAFKDKYISLGIAQTLDKDGKTTNELRSLQEGYELNKETVTSMNNAIRFGSSARADSTVFAGVMAKMMVLATQSFKIKDRDCKTTKRYTMTVTEEYVNPLVFLNFEYKGKPVDKNIESVRKLLGKEIQLRIPTVCLEKGDNLCRVCCGDMLSLNLDSIPHLFITMTGSILQYYLSQFHGVDTTVKEFQIDDLW